MKSSNIINRWRQEYHRQGIPSSFKTTPSESVMDFLELIKKVGLDKGFALDIGCGTGRNSLFLAQKGFMVTAIDFVEQIITRLNETLDRQRLTNAVKTICHDLGTTWPLESVFFDIAIDTFCYKHQITDNAKAIYIDQLQRVMKSNGYFLLTLADIDDTYYHQFIIKSSRYNGPVAIDPGNNIASRLYGKEDVLQDFQKYFKLIKYAPVTGRSAMHGQLYDRASHLFIFQRK